MPEFKSAQIEACMAGKAARSNPVAADGRAAPHGPAHPTRRREWLRLSLGLGAVLGSAASAANGHSATAHLQWRERAMLGFGTTLWLRAGHASADRADAGLDAAIAAIRHVERQMSLFEPTSALCQLNRESVLHNPHPDLVNVLQLAQQVSRRSNGAFDVTVQPLWLAWQAAQRAGRLPTADELGTARAQCGWRALEVSKTRIHLRKPGMALTLNGIAQGFASDLARAALQAHGIEHALINTGEWTTLGRSPDATPWMLGVASPRANKSDPAHALIAKLATDGRAIATSSDAHCSFSADHRHHHIFDPHTGYSPRELASVTVAAPTCAMADALTKVMFMAGPVRAFAVARQWQVDVLVVDKAGRWRASAGLGLG
jgi:FAD:protein FMN transferase